jgi:hypothetical protein
VRGKQKMRASARKNSMHNYLDFEKPISDLEGKILELRKLAAEDESIDTGEEIGRLETRARDAMAEIYARLRPGRKPRSPGTLPVRISKITPKPCSMSSCRSQATANSPRTRQFKQVSQGFAVNRSP